MVFAMEKNVLAKPVNPGHSVANSNAAMNLTYQIGDATQPNGDGPRIIVHVCNDVGGWGKGFVVAVSKRWREPERRYRSWHRGDNPRFQKACAGVRDAQTIDAGLGC